MNKKRRDFLKMSGLTGLAISTGIMNGLASGSKQGQIGDSGSTTSIGELARPDGQPLTVIGPYGYWAAELTGNKLPSLSFRNTEWSDPELWKKAAKKRLLERLSVPAITAAPAVKLIKKYQYDDLQVEELSWQLPYGRPTEAILLKPLHASGRLPAVLAFHDHGGDKYFGNQKITRTSDHQHPHMQAHQKEYYSGLAWANEIAKKGFVVLVPDAFPFASRRVMLKDVPSDLRKGLDDQDQDKEDHILAYNKWAGEHESIMAKSLFCAGTTWPGVFFAEDQKALDILCSREDVDTDRIGCAGLSGGGMRTVFMGGLDPRIKCAVCVGFMTTWKDFLLFKSVNHTWMVYVPLLPNELDFPEILSLRVPLPTLVLNDEEDDLYTPAEMREAERILAEIYHKAGAPSRFKCSYYPGPHKFDASMQLEAFQWLDRWLKA